MFTTFTEPTVLYCTTLGPVWSLCFCRVTETSSWWWSCKCLQKVVFSLTVTSPVYSPHPLSVKEELQCVMGEWLLFGERKKPLELRKMRYTAWIPDFFLSYYLVCVLKVCLIRAWLTFILAIPCKGKWIMDPQDIIEPIQHIYFSPPVFFPLKDFEGLMLFLFTVIYREPNNISAYVCVWCKHTRTHLQQHVVTNSLIMWSWNTILGLRVLIEQTVLKCTLIGSRVSRARGTWCVCTVSFLQVSEPVSLY